jgi:hypothetical protein
MSERPSQEAGSRKQEAGSGKAAAGVRTSINFKTECLWRKTGNELHSNRIYLKLSTN